MFRPLRPLPYDASVLIDAAVLNRVVRICCRARNDRPNMEEVAGSAYGSFTYAWVAMVIGVLGTGYQSSFNTHREVVSLQRHSRLTHSRYRCP